MWGKLGEDFCQTKKFVRFLTGPLAFRTSPCLVIFTSRPVRKPQYKPFPSPSCSNELPEMKSPTRERKLQKELAPGFFGARKRCGPMGTAWPRSDPPPTSPQPPPRTPGAPPARMKEGGGGSPGARGSPATARARADPPVGAQRLPGAPAARRPQFPSELLPRKGADYKKGERPASMLRRVGPQHSTKARPPTSDLHPRNLGAVLDGLGRCTSSCRTLTSETQEWRLATQPTSCATPQHRNRRTQFPLPQAGYLSVRDPPRPIAAAAAAPADWLRKSAGSRGRGRRGNQWNQRWAGTGTSRAVLRGQHRTCGERGPGGGAGAGALGLGRGLSSWTDACHTRPPAAAAPASSGSSLCLCSLSQLSAEPRLFHPALCPWSVTRAQIPSRVGVTSWGLRRKRSPSGSV